MSNGMPIRDPLDFDASLLAVKEERSDREGLETRTGWRGMMLKWIPTCFRELRSLRTSGTRGCSGLRIDSTFGTESFLGKVLIKDRVRNLDVSGGSTGNQGGLGL